MLVKIAGISFAVNDNPSLAMARPSGVVIIKHEPFVHKVAKLSDPDALRVYWNNIAIGYIPKTDDYKQPNPDRAALHDFHKENGNFPSAFVENYSYKPAGTKDFNQDHIGILASIKIAIQLGATDSVSEEEDHNFSHYEKDGEQYERASTILETIDAEGAKGVEGGITRWMIDTFATHAEYTAWMREAAGKGTALHDATEGVCKAGVLDAESRAETETAVKALSDEEFQSVPTGFWNFIAKECDGLKVVDTEQTVFDGDIFVAGTYDILLEGGGKKIIADWKSAKKVNLEHIIKTCFYAKLMDADEAWVVCFGSKNKCGYQLKKVGRESIENGYQIMKQAAKAFYFVRDLKDSMKRGV